MEEVFGVLENNGKLEINKNSKFWELVTESWENSDVILLGDFNFINLCETDAIYENNFKDVWLEIKGLSDVGYTWDAKENPLIRTIWVVANRRLRIDRFIVHKNSKNIEFLEIEIFGKESIGKSYMFTEYRGSDHYGLTTKIVLAGRSKNDGNVQNENFDYFGNRDNILKGRDPRTSGYSMYRLF